MVRKKEIVARLGQLDMLRQAVSTMDRELAYIDPMDKAGRQALRQSLKRTRQQVQLLEEALQVLTPEERIVAELMLICPQRGNVQRLCEILQVEQSSVYRRRDRVLKKVAMALYGETLQNAKKAPLVGELAFARNEQMTEGCVATLPSRLAPCHLP